jgi:Tfp pilus assembly protein FimT
VMRATTVRVCAVDTSDVAAGCSGGTQAWVDGYAVIVEDDGEVLRVEAGSQSITMKSTLTAFRFRDDGTAVSPGNVTFCDVNDDAANNSNRGSSVVQPLVVVISGMGRIRVSEKDGSGNDPNCS